MEIEDIVRISSSIPGAFLPDEMRAMAKYALEFPRESNFVEIGSNLGRSSVILGLVAQQNNCNLTCIDNFIEVPNDMHSSNDVRRSFNDNMMATGSRYNLMDMDSKTASERYTDMIDLLFIDGDHLYEGVRMDIDCYLPKMNRGGIVLLHDYVGRWEGVKKAVDETKGLDKLEVVESMFISRV